MQRQQLELQDERAEVQRQQLELRDERAEVQRQQLELRDAVGLGAVRKGSRKIKRGEDAQKY